jgi:hypothetical protein
MSPANLWKYQIASDLLVREALTIAGQVQNPFNKNPCMKPLKVSASIKTNQGFGKTGYR